MKSVVSGPHATAREKNRILVTGGFGFLGSHVVERLVADPGHHVHVVDDLSTSPLDYRRYLMMDALRLLIARSWTSSMAKGEALLHLIGTMGRPLRRMGRRSWFKKGSHGAVTPTAKYVLGGT